MKKWTLTTLILLAVLIASCSSDPIPGSGSVKIGNKSTFLLPPANPGNLVGDTLMLPEEDTTPTVRAAYCFPGVETSGDFGIGSLVGEASVATLPVNINSGSTVIKSYSITVTISDPAVALDPAGVSGSRHEFAFGTCASRGCPDGCQDYPAFFPNLYDPATGFEGSPTVSGDSVSVTISATDTGLNPASGTLNLAMVPIRVVGTLPYGGVEVVFTVNSLLDGSGNPVAYTPADGLVIEKFYIVYN